MGKVINQNYDESNREDEYNFDPKQTIEDSVIRDMFVHEVKCLIDKFDRGKGRKYQLLYEKAILEIHCGFDQDKEVSDFLDRIDSELIYHINIKSYTKRETVCAFMNTICAFSVLYKEAGGYCKDDTVMSARKIYTNYVTFCQNRLHISRAKMMSFANFKEYLSKHLLIVRKNKSIKGVQVRSDTINGLPQKIA